MIEPLGTCCIPSALWRALLVSVWKVPILALPFCLFFPACNPGPSWINTDGPLILITVDTLRADHLSCYGYQGLNTPNFDALANDGVLYEDTSSTMPMTLPAHATIMTGLTPPVHSVRNNQDYFLPDSAITLAERFTEAGFETAGFISSFVLDGIYGMDQGFGYFSTSRKIRYDLGLDKQKDAATVTEEAIQWIRKAGTNRFFLWVHFFDPHEKYAPPPEFLPAGRHPYDGEIAFVDDRLGRFFKELKRQDLYDQATIILTADHGEGLGDHGERTHGFLTYQSTVKVPLIIKTPEVSPNRVDYPVSLADIYPTALALFDLEYARDDVDGASLVPFLLSRDDKESRVVYFESYLPTLYMGWSGQRGIRLGSLKYIDSSIPELYDLADDPMEQKNLFDVKRSESLQLNKMLSRFREAIRNRNLKTAAQAEHTKNKAEWLDDLIALGYIGGSKMDDKDLERIENRINPSDHIIEYEAFLTDYVEGRLREMQGDYSEALVLYERALNWGLDYKSLADLLTSAGRCSVLIGNFDQAISYANQALEKDPDFLVALIVLGDVENARGNQEKADHFYGKCFRLSQERDLPFPKVSKKIRARAEAFNAR